MAGKYGVKETKDVATLGKVVTVAILKEAAKDGFQWGDLGAFLKSPDFEKAVAEAVVGIEVVPSEMAELGVLDSVELGKHVYGCTMEVVDAFKALTKKPA